MNVLQIPAKVFGQMLSVAYEEDPNECCGILFGKDDKVRYGRKIENVDQGDRTVVYTMHAVQMVQAEDDARKHGLEIVAYYHSHTFSDARPSPKDVDMAVVNKRTAPLYVIVSLKKKTAPTVRAFRISSEGTVTEKPLEVTK